MKELIEKIRKNGLWTDFFNLFAGIVLIVVIALFCLFPGNRLVIALLFILTGAMNLINGIKRYKCKTSRNMGMALIMISAITLIAGTLFLIGTG